jgi:aryl-alcohol dehydrogenase-like predicted oxidoreductase
MKYHLLGKSGLRISELCLGTMTFGEDWGWGADKATCQAMFEAFAKEGGNFIDTANNYTNGTSEKIVGELVHSEREAFVIATKYTLTPTPNQNIAERRPNMVGNHRKNMMQAVEHSLKRLNMEYLDILYLHAWDYTTPIEEVMRGLDDLVRQGKIFYAAISDTPSWIIAEGNTRAELMGWSRFLGIQAPYSLLRRDLEREIMPMARYQDMSVLAWGILGAGILTGKFLKELEQSTRVNANIMENLSPEKVAIVREVVAIGEELGKPAAEVAINWVRQQQHRAHIIPIIGARNMSQLGDNLNVLKWELSQEQLDRLDKISNFDLGHPWTFSYRNDFVYGETYDSIQHPAKLRQVPTVREGAAK